jgi:hypothetical protein
MGIYAAVNIVYGYPLNPQLEKLNEDDQWKEYERIENLQVPDSNGLLVYSILDMGSSGGYFLTTKNLCLSLFSSDDFARPDKPVLLEDRFKSPEISNLIDNAGDYLLKNFPNGVETEILGTYAITSFS